MRCSFINNVYNTNGLNNNHVKKNITKILTTYRNRNKLNTFKNGGWVQNCFSYAMI